MMRVLPILVFFVLFWLPANLAAEQSCGPEKFAAAVDDVGSKLTELNVQSVKGMQRDFEKLAKQQGWPAGRAADLGLGYLQDNETRTLDQEASELLLRLDILSDTESKTADCERLAELKQVIARLLEVTNAKQSHLKAKLAVAVRPKHAAAPRKTKSNARTSNESGDKQAEPRVALKSPVTKSDLPPSKAEKSLQTREAWTTETAVASFPSPPSDVMATLPPVLQQPQDLSFSSDDIRAAGRGFFGSISAELAAVIKFAFDNYGKPNAYILGTDGGLAFLAGLRYGHGELVSKSFTSRKIYWQGPSIGTDFGVTGSRVMVLVYNIDAPEQIFQRFIGVEGAAYLVGGVGITFHKQGRIVLAPIRTGLGLRLGANLGYLKITPRRQFNPF